MKNYFMNLQSKMQSTLILVLESTSIYFAIRLLFAYQMKWIDFALWVVLFAGYVFIWWQKVIQTIQHKLPFYILLAGGIVAICGCCLAMLGKTLFGSWTVLAACFSNICVLYYFIGYCLWAKKQGIDINITYMIYTIPLLAFPFFINICI